MLTVRKRFNIVIDMIVVRNKSKYLGSSYEPLLMDLFVDDMAMALKRIKDVDVVIEVIGGTTTAWEIVKTGLVNNKIVVTANKALVSKYMKELEELNRTTTGTLAFEASVCGGIPIVKSMLRDIQWCAADAFGVERISGVVNGTTNYILTQMEQFNLKYETAVQLAQEEGYAESDPSADVLGWDARCKIQILQRLAFGVTVDPEDIVCEGIIDVQKVDFEYAKTMKCRVKLVATTVGNKNGVRAWVLPTMVPLDNPIATTNGVKNIVSVYHGTMGPVSFTGRGAGGNATGHSVVSDVYNCLLNGGVNKPWFGTAQYCHKNLVADIQLKFYIRLTVSDRVGIIADIGRACEKHSISIDAVLQNPVKPNYDFTKDFLQFVVMTNETTYDKVIGLKGALSLFSWCKREPFVMGCY
jgi:homoserine dehydrogenase